jgi:hypothetical protein
MCWGKKKRKKKKEMGAERKRMRACLESDGKILVGIRMHLHIHAH